VGKSQQGVLTVQKDSSYLGRNKMEHKLLGNEAKEWRSLQAKSRKHNLAVKRVGPANVEFPSSATFGKSIYAQLGTGSATLIMDARIKVKAARAKWRASKK
jgi:hypothetical protein